MQSSRSSPLVQQHRGVQGLLERAVHEAAAVDPDGRVEAWQRGTGLHGRARWARGPSPGAKRDGLAGVEVGRDEDERAAQLAEVIAAAGLGKHALQGGAKALTRQQAVGQQAPQALQRASNERPPSRSSAASVSWPAVGPGAGQTRPRPVPAAQRGRSGRAGGAVLDEGGAQLARRHAVNERGGDEAARTHADVAFTGREVEALDGLLQRNTGRRLRRSPQRPAAGPGPVRCGLGAWGRALAGNFGAGAALCVRVWPQP